MDNRAPDPASLEAGHETSDVSARGVWFTGLGLAIFCVLLLWGIVLIFDLFQSRHEESDKSAIDRNVAPSVSRSIQSFPAPRLQVAPEMDLASFRAWEDAELGNYGWIDRKAGTVRLPIERAMDLIVERGLPFRGQPGLPAPTRTVLDMQQARPSDWAKQNQQTK